MRFITLISLIILTTLSCSRHEDIPNDFYFRIEDEISFINTFDSTYTRKYSNGDTILKIYFTDKEVQKLYLEFKKNGLDGLPQNFEPKCEIMKMPSFSMKLKFNFNGKTYEAFYNSNCELNFFKFLTRYRIIRIKNFIEEVNNLLNQRMEVRQLPKSNLIFM